MLVSKISMASMLKSFGQKMVLPNVILNLIRLTWYADSAQSQRLHSSVWCVGMDVNEYWLRYFHKWLLTIVLYFYNVKSHDLTFRVSILKGICSVQGVQK